LKRQIRLNNSSILRLGSLVALQKDQTGPSGESVRQETFANLPKLTFLDARKEKSIIEAVTTDPWID
jgi:hypothetical protein